jgi:hypothetical protein
MMDWVNFSYVVSGQFVILLALAHLRRAGLSQIYFILWRSMLLGLPFGLLYDILIGESQAVFYYSGVPDNWIFIAINGSLSYGFAIATAWLLPIALQRHQSGGLRLTGAILCITAVALLFVYLVFSLSTLVTMFAIGAILTLSSEGLSLLAGYIGPVYSLSRHNYQPIIRLWLASIGIGTLYELLNWLFPLWHWQEASVMLHWHLEIIIVLFGYFTLFLPMLVLSRLFIRK